MIATLGEVSLIVHLKIKYHIGKDELANFDADIEACK